MKLLTDHGEKLATALIVPACLAWIIVTSTKSGTQVENIDREMKEIEERIQREPLDPNSPWAPAKRVHYTEVLENQFRKPTAIEGGQVPAFVMYPRPQLPGITASGEGEFTVDNAVLPPMNDMLLKSEPGAITICASVPKATLKFFTPVNVQIYRGEAADKVTEKIAELPVSLPDEPTVADTLPGTPPVPAVTTPVGPPPPVVPVFKTFKERQAWEAAQKKKGLPVTPPAPTFSPRGGKPLPPPPVKWDLTYKDAQAKPKSTYFYALRLVARLVDLDADGFAHVRGQKIRVVVPQGLDLIPNLDPTQPKNYAGPLGTPQSQTSLTNMLVRFSGLDGTLPEAGSTSKDYIGFFEVKIWNADTQQWYRKMIRVAPGQALKDTYPLRDADGKTKQVEFDAGYEVVEVQRAVKETVTHYQKQKTTKVMKDGKEEEEAEFDPVTKRPIMEDAERHEVEDTMAAVLKVTATAGLEVYPVSPKFERQAMTLKLERPLSGKWEMGTAVETPFVKAKP